MLRVDFSNGVKSAKSNKEFANLVTDLDLEFTTSIPGKSKSKIALKTQKSRHNAEIPVMASNNPCLPAGKLDYIRCRLGCLLGFVPILHERSESAKSRMPTGIGKPNLISLGVPIGI